MHGRHSPALAGLQDFFLYDPSSGYVSPCTEQASGMLVCSQLTDLVSTAAEFCKAAGEHCDTTPDISALQAACLSERLTIGRLDLLDTACALTSHLTVSYLQAFRSTAPTAPHLQACLYLCTSGHVWLHYVVV